MGELILAAVSNADDQLLAVLPTADERCMCMVFAPGAETATAETVLPICGGVTNFVSAAAMGAHFVVFGEDPDGEPRLHAIVIDAISGNLVSSWMIPTGDYPSVIQVLACDGGFAAIWQELSGAGSMADMWVAVIDTAARTQARTLIAEHVDWGSSAERWVGGPVTFGAIGNRAADHPRSTSLITCVWTVVVRDGTCHVAECVVPDRHAGFVPNPAVATIDRPGTMSLVWTEQHSETSSLIASADVDLEHSRCANVQRSGRVVINPTIIEAFTVDGQNVCMIGGHAQVGRCVAQTYVVRDGRWSEWSDAPVRCDQGLRIARLSDGRPLMVWNDGLTIRSSEWGHGRWTDADEHEDFSDHAAFEPVPLRSGWALVAVAASAGSGAPHTPRPTVTWMGRGHPR